MTNQYLSGTKLCTRADVLQIAFGRADTSSLDYTGSDVDEAIIDATNEAFGRYFPSKQSQFFIESDQTEYEFRPDNSETYLIKQLVIHDIDNADTGMSYQSSSNYTADLNSNKLTFTAAQVAEWANRYCYVDFIPIQWHDLVKNKAALNLLDGDAALMQPGDGTIDNPRVTRIAKRIGRIEADLKPFEVQGDRENINYEPRTVDRPYIKQLRFR